jgi:hypothetical protein
LADTDQEKPKAAANPNLIRFTAPAKLTGYLTLLARDTILGDTAHEVALALVTAEAERRLLADYHKVAVPTAEPRDP